MVIMSAVQQYNIKGRRGEGGKKGNVAAFVPEGENLFCRIDMHLFDTLISTNCLPSC